MTDKRRSNTSNRAVEVSSKHSKSHKFTSSHDEQKSEAVERNDELHLRDVDEQIKAFFGSRES